MTVTNVVQMAESARMGLTAALDETRLNCSYLEVITPEFPEGTPEREHYEQLLATSRARIESLEREIAANTRVCQKHKAVDPNLSAGLAATSFAASLTAAATSPATSSSAPTSTPAPAPAPSSSATTKKGAKQK